MAHSPIQANGPAVFTFAPFSARLPRGLCEHRTESSGESTRGQCCQLCPRAAVLLNSHATALLRSRALPFWFLLRTKFPPDSPALSCLGFRDGSLMVSVTASCIFRQKPALRANIAWMSGVPAVFSLNSVLRLKCRQSDALKIGQVRKHKQRLSFEDSINSPPCE